ncbi:MAG TPA: hypothetical protein V6C88_14420 [Chroococcidiopsis sp.]
MSLRIPRFRLTYAGTDITRAVQPYRFYIGYSDKLEGESDDLEIRFENSDLRWLDSWAPAEGDTISLQLGYEGEKFLGPIVFEIDEPEYAGPPDRLTLKGVATPISKSLRQKNTQAYEKIKLKAIAQQIAEKHSLELVGGDKIPDITLDRVTQKEQSDLEFLRSTAAEYGLIFKVDSCTKLVFFKESELEDAAAVLTLARTVLKSYRLRRGVKGTYKAAELSYKDPRSGKFITATIDATGAAVTTPTEGESAIASGDILKIRERVENLEQAEIKATEALRRANRGQVQGSIDLEGNVAIAAGVNLNLTGFGGLSGKYQVTAVRHTLSKTSGYQTSVEIKGLELKRDK